MQYKTLGNTNLKVSVIGFGGIPIQRISKEQSVEIIRGLAEKGVNFIDTARAYTVSEEYIGYALEQLNLRDKFVIATKTMARTYHDMKKDIEISLKNLRTNCIDLYQLHNMRTDADFETVFGDNGAMLALLEAVKEGKVKHIGASAHGVAQFERLLGYKEIETIMFPYNIVENQGEQLMQRANNQGVGFIAMKPMAGGNITDGTLALRYILQNPNCTIAIPGMANMDEINENVAAADHIAPITQDEQEKLNAIREKLGNNFCRRCGYCMPCTAKIDIPSLFILYGYFENYDLEGWARQRYETVPAKASECTACGLCEKRCPYDLPIREKMKKIAKDLG